MAMHSNWNPWHGCIKCSEGCKNCYVYAIPADEVARRNSTWYNRGVRAEQGEDETCSRRRELPDYRNGT